MEGRDGTEEMEEGQNGEGRKVCGEMTRGEKRSWEEEKGFSSYRCK